MPAIVGTEHGTEVWKDGQSVTVSGAEGEIGFVYDGKTNFDVQRTNLKDLTRPRTQVMMNITNPEEAFSLSFIPNDGVGLAREGFIISNSIKMSSAVAGSDNFAWMNCPSFSANSCRICSRFYAHQFF